MILKISNNYAFVLWHCPKNNTAFSSLLEKELRATIQESFLIKSGREFGSFEVFHS